MEPRQVMCGAGRRRACLPRISIALTKTHADAHASAGSRESERALGPGRQRARWGSITEYSELEVTLKAVQRVAATYYLHLLAVVVAGRLTSREKLATTARSGALPAPQKREWRRRHWGPPRPRRAHRIVPGNAPLDDPACRLLIVHAARGPSWVAVRNRFRAVGSCTRESVHFRRRSVAT